MVEIISSIGKWAGAFLILSYPIGAYFGRGENQQFQITTMIFLISFEVLIASALALLVDKIRGD